MCYISDHPPTSVYSEKSEFLHSATLSVWWYSVCMPAHVCSARREDEHVFLLGKSPLSWKKKRETRGRLDFMDEFVFYYLFNVSHGRRARLNLVNGSQIVFPKRHHITIRNIHFQSMGFRGNGGDFPGI